MTLYFFDNLCHEFRYTSFTKDTMINKLLNHAFLSCCFFLNITGANQFNDTYLAKIFDIKQVIGIKEVLFLHTKNSFACLQKCPDVFQAQKLKKEIKIKTYIINDRID